VIEWRRNNAVVIGNTSNTYTLENLSAASTVTVAFDRITNAEMLPETNPFRAWVSRGNLYVTGLTAGETLSVYSSTGTLIHRGVVATDETGIPLSAHGVYIVQSGNNTIRVVFN